MYDAGFYTTKYTAPEDVRYNVPFIRRNDEPFVADTAGCPTGTPRGPIYVPDVDYSGYVLPHVPVGGLMLSSDYKTNTFKARGASHDEKAAADKTAAATATSPKFEEVDHENKRDKSSALPEASASVGQFVNTLYRETTPSCGRNELVASPSPPRLGGGVVGYVGNEMERRQLVLTKELQVTKQQLREAMEEVTAVREELGRALAREGHLQEQLDETTCTASALVRDGAWTRPVDDKSANVFYVPPRNFLPDFLVKKHRDILDVVERYARLYYETHRPHTNDNEGSATPTRHAITLTPTGERMKSCDEEPLSDDEDVAAITTLFDAKAKIRDLKRQLEEARRVGAPDREEATVPPPAPSTSATPPPGAADAKKAPIPTKTKLGALLKGSVASSPRSTSAVSSASNAPSSTATTTTTTTAGGANSAEAKRALSSGEWREMKDPKSGRPYYVNVKTKQTTWDLAAELAKVKR
eukprot:PhM_4_TR6365/c0_g1_i1/m.100584